MADGGQRAVLTAAWFLDEHSTVEHTAYLEVS
jgi:hypothetical protein